MRKGKLFTHYVTPRGVGKTTELVKLYKECPEDTIVLTGHKATQDYLKQLGVLSYDLEILPGLVSNKKHRNTYKRILIDEYLDCKISDKLYFLDYFTLLLRNISYGSVIAFSTPYRYYNGEAFLYYSYRNRGQYSLAEIYLERIIPLLYKNRMHDYHQGRFDLRSDMINPLFTNIIQTSWGVELSESAKESHKNNLGLMQYEFKILGNFLDYGSTDNKDKRTAEREVLRANSRVYTKASPPIWCDQIPL